MSGGRIYITMQNLVQIDGTVAELTQFFDFQDYDRLLLDFQNSRFLVTYRLGWAT